MDNKIKKISSTQLFEKLGQIAEFIPTPLYWYSIDGIVLGVNDIFCKQVGGLNLRNRIQGKRHDDYYPKHLAKVLNENNRRVIETGETIEFEEEVMHLLNGQTIFYTSIKSPWRDDNGKIIGIIGSSVEITHKKEKERLALENERLKFENEAQKLVAHLQEQEKFRMLARKVAHDINSPVAALRMMLEECKELPESKRIFLRRAAESILDIANNLLLHDRKEEHASSDEIERSELLLVSDLLIHLLSEKKVQYQEHPVTFDTVIENNAQFAFIPAQHTEFQRAMSNLINNAVDAVEGKENGQVTVQLTANANSVVVEIKDNGKGMPPAMIEKIQNAQSFTEGKENGHGLGLQQVWDMLEYNQGTMEVQSLVGKGSSIELTFPRAAASNWIAQEIHLIPGSIIVILDDDESIHTAWSLRFTPLMETYPTLRLHHFTHGQEVLNFLAKLSPEKKEHVIFLSDYELLHQERHGLQIIEASRISNAMLVTSYYSSLQIREAAEKLEVKVLPKQMASVIPIFVN